MRHSVAERVRAVIDTRLWGKHPKLIHKMDFIILETQCNLQENKSPA